MKQFFLILKVLFVYFMLVTAVLAKESDYFKKGKELFQNNELDKSKIFFERDIVFNPKSENSYLYLAKIFNIKENEEEEEMNLQNVLILNPKNDEAIYMLINLKIKQSDYDEADDLIKKFELVCKNFCSKKEEILKKFNKLIPNE